MSRDLFVGVDVGASRTKVAILDQQKKLVGHAIRKSGTDFAVTSEACLQSALEVAQSPPESTKKCLSTGYGRKNVSFSQETKTEIGCHAKGCFHYYPM